MKPTMSLRLAALAATALPFAAFAEAPFHVSNDEAGTIYHVVPSRPGDAAQGTDIQAHDPNWEYKGGETSWELRQHAYEFRGARLVHADSFDHASPRQVVDAREVSRRDAALGGG